MQRETIKKTLAAIAISMAVGLVGCGGGGGDDEPEPTTFDADTSGKVAKGIVQFGPVTAEELDVNGNVLREVGSAVTDVNGDYTLNIGDAYAGGVIRLTLSSDGTTTKMVCDVQPDCGGILFGETIDLSSTFSMLALLSSVQDGDAVSAQITPFSHMAASRVAGGTDGFTSDAVKTAISEINQMVGVDVLYTSPVDITDTTIVDTSSTEELVYSAFTAGVGALMFDAVDLETGLQELADTFADGVFDSTDDVSILSVLDSVETQAIASGIDSLVLDQILATIEAELVDTDGDGILDEYDPEPTDSATLTAVEQAKALVSEIRTLATSIEELESPASVFRADLDLTSTLVNNNTQALLELMDMVVIGVIEYIGENIPTGTIVLGTEYPVTIYDASFTEIGIVNVVLTDNNGLSMAISGSGLLGIDVDLTISSNLPAASLLDMTSFDSSLAEFELNGLLNNAETSIALNAMEMVFTYSGDTTVLLDPVNPLELTVDHDLLTNLSLDGGLVITDTASGASFTGSTTIELIELTSNADDPDNPNPLSLSEITLNGVFANSNDSFSADLGLTINNAASFDTIAFLEHEAFLWVNDYEFWDVFGFQDFAIAQGVTLISASYDPSTNQTCGIVQELPDPYCESGDVLNTHDYFVDMFPDAIIVGDFRVDYYADVNITSFNGYVEFGDFETATNYVDATLTATLALALENYPETTTVVTVNRTELDGGNAIVTLTSDGNSVTFNLLKTDDDTTAGSDPITASLTVSNPDGVQLVISGLTQDLPISGDLAVDGTNVGTIEETDLGLVLVRYVDGTFETLY